MQYCVLALTLAAAQRSAGVGPPKLVICGGSAITETGRMRYDKGQKRLVTFNSTHICTLRRIQTEAHSGFVWLCMPELFPLIANFPTGKCTPSFPPPPFPRQREGVCVCGNAFEQCLQALHQLISGGGPPLHSSFPFVQEASALWWSWGDELWVEKAAPIAPRHLYS